jgi:hypothetical protein
VGRDATSCQTRIGTSQSLGCKGKFFTLLWSSRLLSRCCHVYLQHGLMPYPRGATIVARYGKQASGGPRFSSSQSKTMLLERIAKSEQHMQQRGCSFLSFGV